MHFPAGKSCQFFLKRKMRMHIVLRTMNPHFMKIKMRMLVAHRATYPQIFEKKNLRMPGFEPGPLTCFRTYLIFRERFCERAHLERAKGFLEGQNTSQVILHPHVDAELIVWGHSFKSSFRHNRLWRSEDSLFGLA